MCSMSLILFIFIQFFSNVYSFNFSNNQINSNCVTSKGTSGICKLIYDCSIIRFQLTRQDVCYFEGRDPIVCCESVLTNNHFNSNSTNSVNSLNQNNQNLNFSNSVLTPTDSTTQIKETTNNFGRSQHIANNMCYDYQTNVNDFRKYSPVIATIGWKSSRDNIKWKCAGFVISENFIATAAHCAYDRGLRANVVRIEDFNLYTNQSINQNFNITEIYVHPSYKNALMYDDIALLKITPNVTFNSHIKPACLWTENNLPENDVLSIGYNQVNNEFILSNLALVENSRCNGVVGLNLSLPNGIQENQICAQNSVSEVSICRSVSGGPLIFQKEKGDYFGQYLIGIASFGESCSSSKPIVFTRVSSYIDWIVPIVWPNATIERKTVLFYP